MIATPEAPVRDAACVLAYRERAHTRQGVMALLLRPTRAAADVLRALRGTLLVRRHLRNVMDATVVPVGDRATDHMICTTSSHADKNVTAAEGQGAGVPCKLCLLDPSVVPCSAESTNDTQASSCSDKGESKTRSTQEVRWVSIADEAQLKAELGGVAAEVVRRLHQVQRAAEKSHAEGQTRTSKEQKEGQEGDVHVALVRYEVEMTYKQYTMPELLRLALNTRPAENKEEGEEKETQQQQQQQSQEQQNELTLLSGFEQIGHIAHLNLSPAHLPYRYIIGAILLDCNPTVSVVVNKVTAIATVFREFKMELIARRANYTGAQCGTSTPRATQPGNLCAPADAKECDHAEDKGGEEDRIVWAETLPEATLDALLTATVRQDGCVFHVPYNRVYWNSRLNQEHRRLVQKMQRSDILFDVMAGVGPFVIPAAQRGVRVYANDLNPTAAEAMKTNLALNRLAPGSVRVHNMDGRDFLNGVVRTHVCALADRAASTLHTMRYHVVMNLPAIAVTFLDVFAPHTTPSPGVHTQTTTATTRDRTTWRNAPVVLPSAAHERVLLLHVYCFSAHEDVLQDALRQVEHHLGYALPAANVEGLHMVRDVSPHKRMVCVSFTLPPAFWHAAAHTVQTGESDEEAATSAADDAPCKRQKTE